MGRCIGVLERIHGRWIWPFREMEIGDWFYVAHEDKTPGAVRNFAGTTGERLGCHFSVRKNDPEKPGFTRVERVAAAGGKHWKAGQRVVEYGTLQERIWASYRVRLDEHFDGRSVVIETKRVEPTPRRAVVLKIPHPEKFYGVSFHPDMVMITELDERCSPDDFLARMGEK